MADDSDYNDSAVMLAAGAALGDPHQVGEGRFIVVPDGYKVEDLERFLVAPLRARAAVTAKTVATLCAYLNRFKTDATAIFADQDKSTVVGIVDYHHPEQHAFREHRVAYTAPRSLEWATWRSFSGKKMSQAEFALFIEENVVDIKHPDGATVLEVSRSLQAKSKVEFASALRLADGQQQFTYSETIDGSTAKGQMKVPEQFTLGLPVFFGGPLYEVLARLRYRIAEGKLVLWYDLYRPEYIERDAFQQITQEIAAETGVAVWDGVP